MLVLNVIRIQIVAILVIKLPPQPTVRDHHPLPPSSPHHQCLPMIPTTLTKLMFVKAIALFAEDVGVAIMLPELIGDPKGQVNDLSVKIRLLLYVSLRYRGQFLLLRATIDHIMRLQWQQSPC